MSEKYDDLLQNRESLKKLLQQVPVSDLADAMATRTNVMSLTTDGVRVLTISNSQQSPVAS